MNDERVERRPLLRLENAGDGLWICRIARQPINRLRRQRHDPAR